MDQCAQQVRDDVDAIRVAAAAGDLAEWTDAAHDARAGLARLRRLVERARGAMGDAADAQVRTRLDGSPTVLGGAESLVAGAPAVPDHEAPIVRCGP